MRVVMSSGLSFEHSNWERCFWPSIVSMRFLLLGVSSG
jgi:hypothetical protein